LKETKQQGGSKNKGRRKKLIAYNDEESKRKQHGKEYIEKIGKCGIEGN
jgi:hypothetical protein